MPQSPQVKSALLETSKECAAALIEDIDHIRSVLTQQSIHKGEARRLSASLRRILIDKGGDISLIAPPRMGKIRLHSPDNSSVYGNERKLFVKCFGSGCGDVTGFKLFEGNMRALVVQHAASSLFFRMPKAPVPADINKLVELSHDGFLSNRVLYLNDMWANRREVIKYVANAASGVHTGEIRSNADTMLAKFRNCVNLRKINGKLDTNVNLDRITSPSVEFEFKDNQIDFVFYELLCAAHFFVTSPSIMVLYNTIRHELGMSA